MNRLNHIPKLARVTFNLCVAALIAITILLVSAPILQIAAAQSERPSGVSETDTVYVAPPTGEKESDRASILTALDEVKAGGTVHFASGTYLIGEFIRVSVPRVTLHGHTNGTTLRGCNPDEYPEYEVQRLACNGLELAAGHQTVRNLTIEHAWHGIHIGCCVDQVMESVRTGEGGPSRTQPGGHLIEDNRLRSVGTAMRVIGESSDPIVIRRNVFRNVFHALVVNGGTAHMLDNDISSPEPDLVPAGASSGGAIGIFPTPPARECGENMIAGNRIEGHPDGIGLAVGVPGTRCERNVVRDNTIIVRRVPIRENPFGLRIGNRIADNVVTGVERRDPFPGNLVNSAGPESWREANGSAIWLSPGSNGNEITGNTFEEIAASVIVIEGDSNRVEMRDFEDEVRDLGTGNHISRIEVAPDTIRYSIIIAGHRKGERRMWQEGPGNWRFEYEGDPYDSYNFPRSERLVLDAEGLPVQVEIRGERGVEVDGRSRRIHHYAVHGLDLKPAYVWLDESGTTFADEWSVLSGWETEFSELRLATEEALAEHHRGLVRSLVPPARDRPLAITGARLFDPQTHAVRAGTTILIDGNRIAAVGADGSVEVTPGAEMIDAAGRMVLPGLWDMHAHHGIPADELFAPLHLAGGITTARDLGSHTGPILSLRSRIESGEALGPRLLLSGFIDGPGRRPSGVLVGSVAEVRAAVDRFAELGYVQIKIFGQVPPDLVPSIIERARAHGMRVSGHVPAGMNLRDAVEAGFDEIQHADQIFDNVLDIVRQMHEAGVPVLPGSDMMPGIAVHRELELYVEADIPATEVLTLATLGAARIMGMDDELGSIEPGKLADLILVDGDPTKNISDIRRVMTVIKDGRVYDPAAIYRALGIEPCCEE